ncbi:MAG: hypothetical protein KC912_11725 [Proteobacteria bacterium]|nr:hypothetical protein [Pseudomonadota bacterium]
MDLKDTALLGVIAVMAINHMVMRAHGLRGNPLVFWTLQLANLGVGTGLIVLGLPGFEGLPAVTWLLALLFFFRVVQNNNARQAWLLEEVGHQQEVDQKATREAFLDALHKGEGKDPAGD